MIVTLKLFNIYQIINIIPSSITILGTCRRTN